MNPGLGHTQSEQQLSNRLPEIEQTAQDPNKQKSSVPDVVSWKIPNL